MAAMTPLRKYRKQNELSFEEACVLFGVSKGTLSKWENNRVGLNRVLDVERITGISRHALRPDFFGELRQPERAA